jgi:hypothetical protein
MNQQMATPYKRIDPPMTYIIRVIGELDAGWLDKFRDTSILITMLPGIGCVSMICTHNADQGVLVGLINALYNHEYPIIGLKCLGGPNECETFPLIA